MKLPDKRHFVAACNLEPTVLRMFGQRVGARRDSGDLKKKLFDGLIRNGLNCFNTIPVPQSLFWRPAAGKRA